LTGLLTQRVFQEKLEAAILEASRYNQPLSLILADIDHFKMVNDNYGHPAGDQVLQGFAHILDRNVRDVDVISRYGGEEFAILLYQMDHASAVKVAEKIRSDLADQGFEFERGTLSVTGSFGVSTFPEDATSGQQLFRQADQRLYKAKHAGRNQTKGRIG
jgi:diguanylate cyclase (GGDEF)-like protein